MTSLASVLSEIYVYKFVQLDENVESILFRFLSYNSKIIIYIDEKHEGALEEYEIILNWVLKRSS